MEYKLLLGDTLELLRAMKSESVELGVTSPPYPGVPDFWGEFFAPENFDAAHLWLDQVWCEYIRILKPGCKLIINIANIGRNPYLANHARLYQWAWQNNDIEPKGDIIWRKTQAQSGETAWGSFRNPADMHLTDGHEYIAVFRKNGERNVPTRDYIIAKDDFLSWRKSIWEINTTSATKRGHIAPFPIEIPKRIITLYSFPNEIVLDAFSGSGTTGEACALLDRDYIGIDHSAENNELARGYIETAMTRMGHQSGVERRGDKKKVSQMGAFA